VAYTFEVTSKTEAENHVSDLKVEHPKSRHVCYAYMLPNPDEFRANDDGEPSGSAGLPILNQIRSSGLKGVLVAVVRYFGGTKLGVPGLINAYKTSAREAIVASGEKVQVEQVVLTLSFHYAQMEAVMSFIKSKNYELLRQKFEESCTLTIKSPLEDLEDCEKYFGTHHVELDRDLA